MFINFRPSSFSISARWWNVIARKAGPPVVRPKSSAAAKSMPDASISATGCPVAAFSSGVPSRLPRRHSPQT